MRPQFDERDGEILAANVAAWDAREGARVGDWCRMPDGDMRRFTHDWGDGLQTTCKDMAYGASFYFGRGFMSFSGGLDPTIPRSRIVATDETKPGAAWFFHHNHSRAHNGVYFDVPCRVFEVRHV